MNSLPSVAVRSLLMLTCMAFFPAPPATGESISETHTLQTAAGRMSPCGTNESWERRAWGMGLSGRAGDCPQLGPCDSPGTRDTTSIVPLNIGVIVHVIRNDDGSGGVPQDTVDTMIARINADFAANSTGFHFTLLATRFHNDSHFATVNNRLEIDSLRARYAETPALACNIYVSFMFGMNAQAGLSTHPWEPEALDSLGGIWVNRGFDGSAIGVTRNSATHEMGHVLGLWHIFRAAEELGSEPCNDPCYEAPCGLLVCGSENDARGDFAADTPPTPLNETCGPPGGTDCLGLPWGATQPQNIMGYAPDACRTLFTPQQIRRMQCWTKNVLSSWLIQPVEVDEIEPAAGMNIIVRPNPATREVVAVFSLLRPGDAMLELLDIFGRRVAQRRFNGLAAGRHVVTFDDGRASAPGVYVARFTQGSVVMARKAVLIR